MALKHILNRLNPRDAEIIHSPVPVPVHDFGKRGDYVELHVYDVNDNYLDSSIIEDFMDGDQLKLKPGNDLRDMGFSEGRYIVDYNFLRRVGGTEETVLVNADKSIYKGEYYVTDEDKIYKGTEPVIGQGDGGNVDQPVEVFVEDYKFFIQEISPSRREVRLAPLDIQDNEYLKEFENLAVTEVRYEPIERSLFGSIALNPGGQSGAVPTLGADTQWKATLHNDDGGFIEEMVGGTITINDAFLVRYKEEVSWIPNPNAGTSTVAPAGDTIPAVKQIQDPEVLPKKKQLKRVKENKRKNLKRLEESITSNLPKGKKNTIDRGEDRASSGGGGGGAAGGPPDDILMSVKYEVIWETTDIPQFARTLDDSGAPGSRGGAGAGGGGGAGRGRRGRTSGAGAGGGGGAGRGRRGRTSGAETRQPTPKTKRKRKKEKVEEETLIVKKPGGKKVTPPTEIKDEVKIVKGNVEKKKKKKKKLPAKLPGRPKAPTQIKQITYVPIYKDFTAIVTKVIDKNTIELDKSYIQSAALVGNLDGAYMGSKPRQKVSFYVDYKTATKSDMRTLLNFGDNVMSLSTNWKYDKDSIVNWPHSIIYKLYESLPDDINVFDKCTVVKEMLSSVEEEVFLVPFVDEKIDAIFLRSPNFDSKDGESLKPAIRSRPTDYETKLDILSGDGSVSQSLINEFISQSADSVDLSIDYSQHENYVHFGSAKKRLSNFKYKLQQIESYVEQSSSLESISGARADIGKWEMKQRKFINEFDGYEKYLYEKSSSYSTSSNGEFFDGAWPKESGTGTVADPYVVYHSTSSKSSNWFTTTANTASLYDVNNPNRLVNLLPQHIRDNDENSTFLDFMDMIGHHFDIVWSYIRSLTDVHSRDDKLTEGVSKDLLYDVAKSLGLKLFDGKDLVPLSRYALGKEVTGSKATTPVYSEVPERDISREIWKRLLNNLPFFLKNKGTVRALKAIINCYGIPSTILRVREFGGPDLPGTATSYSITKKFTKALNFRAGQYIAAAWQNDSRTGRRPDTVELRFRSLGSDGTTDRTLVRDKAGGWALMLLDNASVDNIGRVAFRLSGSDGYKTVSSSAYSVFDGDFWSVMLTRMSASDAQLSSDAIDQSIKYTLYTKKYDSGRSKIFLNDQISMTVPGNANVASQSYNAAFTGSSGAGKLILGGLGSGAVGSQLTGSMMEFRLWGTSLNESAFDNHVASPKSYNGNHASSSWTDLILRYSFDDNIDLSSDPNIRDITPDQTYESSGSAKGYTAFNKASSFSSVVDEEKMFVPNVGPNRRISNKVRIESSSLANGQLSMQKRSELSSYDFAPVDSNKLGIYFAPTDVVNEDIIRSVANLDFNQYLGDPRDKTKYTYRGLEKIRGTYWQKWNSPANFWAYMRMIRFYDQTIFDQLKALVPARSKPTFGTVIEPNIFERPKDPSLQRDPTYEDLSFRATINLTSYGPAAALSMSAENPYYEGSASADIFDEPNLSVIDSIDGKHGFGSLYATASVTVGGPDYVFIEGAQPFISESRLSEHNRERVFYYSSSLSQSLHSTYGFLPYAYSSSEFRSRGDTKYYQSSTLANLFFEGCTQTFNTTPDGGPVIETTIVKPTRLVVQEPGESRLKTELG